MHQHLRQGHQRLLRMAERTGAPHRGTETETGPGPTEARLRVFCRRHQAVTSLRPTAFTQLRTWTLLQTLLDTGCRINELLTLTKENVDFDNLLLTVHGKGNKTRKVPFSPDCRKVLFRYKVAAEKKKLVGNLFFCVRNGKGIRYRNIYRDIIGLCQAVGITKRIHCHLTRHTFACHFMKNGGSIYSLSRILGHSSVSTTQIYIRGLGVEDFQQEQARLSPLTMRA